MKNKLGGNLAPNKADGVLKVKNLNTKVFRCRLSFNSSSMFTALLIKYYSSSGSRIGYRGRMFFLLRLSLSSAERLYLLGEPCLPISGEFDLSGDVGGISPKISFLRFESVFRSSSKDFLVLSILSCDAGWPGGRSTSSLWRTR